MEAMNLKCPNCCAEPTDSDLIEGGCSVCGKEYPLERKL